MVTTYKKSRAQEWTWSGSGFTRQTPSEKQLAAPKPSLVYKRARYYHPQLGQFISRDPLGYVDGMSQYRAYFVPGAVDPLGLYFQEGGSDKEKVEELLKKIVDALNASGLPNLTHFDDKEETAGFDCDDFSHCGFNVLKDIGGDAVQIKMFFMQWKNSGGLSDVQEYKPKGHVVLLATISGVDYLIDPQGPTVVKGKDSKAMALLLEKGRISGFIPRSSTRTITVPARDPRSPDTTRTIETQNIGTYSENFVGKPFAPDKYYDNKLEPHPDTRSLEDRVRLYKDCIKNGIETDLQNGTNIDDWLNENQTKK